MKNHPQTKKALKSLITLLLFMFPFFVNSAVAGNPCDSSAKNTSKSCKESAKADYYVTLAQCDNLAGSAQKTCTNQAKDDKKSANEECNKQNDARRDICKQLDGAAYNPVY